MTALLPMRLPLAPARWLAPCLQPLVPFAWRPRSRRVFHLEAWTARTERSMSYQVDGPASVRFGAGATRALAVRSRHPLVLACVEGRLWVTLASDVRDHILEPGASIEAAGGQSAVVHAQGRALLTMAMPAAVLLPDDSGAPARR